MKRWIGALLVLCMMMTCCVGFAAEAAEADVFTMPNGVRFGMTWEEVDALETGEFIGFGEEGSYCYALTTLGRVDLTEYFPNAQVEYYFNSLLGLEFISYRFDATMPKLGHATDCLLEFAIVENGFLEEFQLFPIVANEFWSPGTTQKASEEGRALAILTGEMELSSGRIIHQNQKTEVWSFHNLGFNVFGEYEHTIIFTKWD